MAQAFGPDERPPPVRTGRSGAAAKAGHDLLIQVTAWDGTLDPDGDPAVTLSADPRSLRVLEGTGGMQALDDDDKAGIEQTIDDEVLKGAAIRFRSTELRRAARHGVEGDLTLRARRARSRSTGRRRGRRAQRRGGRQAEQLGHEALLALFGALKVVDEVEVADRAAARTAPSRCRPPARRARPRRPAAARRCRGRTGRRPRPS